MREMIGERVARTFRVFVSSTFLDFIDERNALERSVFPRLRQMCESHGCSFQAIDLRWGIREEASQQQRTVRICLEEIARCQRVGPPPNFIVLLGDRYGWVPAPDELTDLDFRELLDRSSSEDRELLDRWYQIDENARPPTRVLRPRDPSWASVEPLLLAALKRAAVAAGWGERRRAACGASATEQEVWHGALLVDDASRHVFAFLRAIDGLPIDPAEGRILDTAATRWVDPAPDGSHRDLEALDRLEHLKSRLRQRLGASVHEYRAQWDGATISGGHVETLCADVHAALETTIRRELAKMAAVDPLEAERAAHAGFARERTRVFIGRDDLLAQIGRYVASGEGRPLVVRGAAGTGKSALLARACEVAVASVPGAIVVQRYAGVTASSSRERPLLESIAAELAKRTGTPFTPSPAGRRDTLAQWFRDRLTGASSTAPRILFLDALEQIDGLDGMPWLPVPLPYGVRIVLSVREGTPIDAALGRLATSIDIPPIRNRDAGEILDRWLEDAGRSLTPPQRRAVLQAAARDSTPLFLRLAFEEARRWRSWVDVPSGAPGDGIAGAVIRLLERLGAEAEHGPVLAAHALGYLCAARDGLAEDDLLDVLSADLEVHEDFASRAQYRPPAQRLPVVLWSRLFFEIEPYLAERSAGGKTVFAFFHAAMKEVLTEHFDAAARRARHDALAQYFEQQPIRFGTNGQSRLNERKIREQIFQQAHGMRWRALERSLGDPAILDAYCRWDVEGGGVHALADDAFMAANASASTASDVSELAAAVARAARDDAAALRSLPALALQQLHNTLIDETAPAVERLVADIATVQATAGIGWFRRVDEIRGNRRTRLLSDEHDWFSVAVHADTHRLAALHYVGLDIWDLASAKIVTRLEVEERRGTPVAVRWLDRGALVAAGWSNGAIVIYDPAGRVIVERLQVEGPLIAFDTSAVDRSLYALDCNGRGLTSWTPASDTLRRQPDLPLIGRDLSVSGGGDTLVIGGSSTPEPALWAARADIWRVDPRTGALRRLRRFQTKEITRVRVDQVGATVACGDDRGNVSVLDARTGALLAFAPGELDLVPFDIHEFNPLAALLSEMREVLVRGGQPHFNSVSGLAYDGRLVASTGVGDLRVFDSRTRTIVAERTVARGEDLAWTPGGQLVVAGSQLLSIVEQTTDPRRPRPGALFDLVAANADGSQLAAAQQIDIIIIGAPGDESVELRAAHSGRIVSLSWQPHGTLLASAGEDGCIRIWDVERQAAIREVRWPSGEVRAVCFTPDGRRVACAGDGYCLLVPVDGGSMLELRAEANFTSLAADADGRIAAASLDKRCWLWDLPRTKRPTIVTTAHEGLVSAVALPSGGGIVTASRDRTCRQNDRFGVEQWSVSLDNGADWVIGWPHRRTVIVGTMTSACAIDSRDGTAAHLPGRGGDLAGASLDESRGVLRLHDAIGASTLYRVVDLPGGTM